MTRKQRIRVAGNLAQLIQTAKSDRTEMVFRRQLNNLYKRKAVAATTTR